MPSNSRRESEAIVATFLIHPECPFELSLKPIQASKKTTRPDPAVFGKTYRKTLTIHNAEGSTTYCCRLEKRADLISSQNNTI